MTVEQLKALAYDQLIQLSKIQANLSAIEREILNKEGELATSADTATMTEETETE